MARGKAFWGTEEMLALLLKFLDRYLELVALDDSNEEAKAEKTLAVQQFWSNIRKKFFHAFNTPESMKKEIMDKIKTWYRNKANNKKTVADVVFIPVKAAQSDASANKTPKAKTPAAKKAAKKIVKKGIHQYLHGQTKRMPTAPETYAKEYSAEFEAILAVKWKAHKDKIIAQDVKLQTLSEKEITKHFKKNQLKFRRKELEKQYSKQSDKVKSICEKKRREKAATFARSEVSPVSKRREAIANASAYVHDTLKDLSEETGYSFFVLAGGPDPRANDEIRLFTVDIPAMHEGKMFKKACANYDGLKQEFHELLTKNYNDADKRKIDPKGQSEEVDINESSTNIPRKAKKPIILDSDDIEPAGDSSPQSGEDYVEDDEDDSNIEEDDEEDSNIEEEDGNGREGRSPSAPNVDDSGYSVGPSVIIGNDDATDEVLYEHEEEAEALAAEAEEFRVLTKMDMAVDYDNGTDDTDDMIGSDENISEKEDDEDGSEWEDIIKGNITKEGRDRLYKKATRLVKKSNQREDHMNSRSSTYDSDADDEERSASVDARRYKRDIDYGGADLEDSESEGTDSALVDEDRETEPNLTDGEEATFESFHGMKSASNFAEENAQHSAAFANATAVVEVDDESEEDGSDTNEEHTVAPSCNEKGIAAEERPEENRIQSLVKTLGIIQHPQTHKSDPHHQKRHQVFEPDPSTDEFDQVPEWLNVDMLDLDSEYNTLQTPVKIRESRISEYEPAPETPDFNTPKPPAANNGRIIQEDNRPETQQMILFGSSPLTSPPTSDPPFGGLPQSSWDTDTPVFIEHTSRRRNAPESIVPWVVRIEEFIREKLGSYSLSIIKHYRRFEELHGNKKMGGVLWKANLMPDEMKIFRNFHSFLNLRIPSNASQFGEAYSPWYEAIQPIWRLDPAKRHLNCKKNILFNDSWSLPDDEQWENLNVGGLDGFVLVIIGVAIWSESAKKDARARGVSKVIEKTIIDIHEVLEMMVAYMEKREDAREEKGKKRIAAEATEEKRVGKKAKTKTGKSGKENRK